MDIKHAGLIQIRRGRNGKVVQVENDVLDVVKQLREISPSLSVNWNEYGEYFSVVETDANGKERLVTTSIELTPALIERIRKVGHCSYNYGAEMDRLDREAKARKEHEFAEQIGEHGERLYHALRKDLQVKDKIYVPGYAR